MVKNANDFSALFRSIEPDDALRQASEATAIQEAEQRWPLFETLRPRKSELTPSLSADEKQQWQPHAKAHSSERKPMLPVESIGKKMAESLRKMAPARASTSPKVVDQAEFREIPQAKTDSIPTIAKDLPKKKLVLQKTEHFATPDLSNDSALEVQPSTPVHSKVVLSKIGNQNASPQNKDAAKKKPVAKPSTSAGRITQSPEPKSQQLVLPKSGTKAALPAPIKHQGPATTPADQSLANMFGRLTAKKNDNDVPPPKDAAKLLKLNKK